MKLTALAVLGLSVTLALSGCKIVKDATGDDTAIPADASGDDARTALRITETFEPKLLPLVAEKALTVDALKAALGTGLDKAGEAHGNRGAGAGAAWNFAVSGSGTVVEAKLDTRARQIGVDVDSDGKADLTVQLGPVVKGTGLRDIAPFYNFDDFRDQIEFAKLGRALNDAVTARLTLPEGDLIGHAVTFTGVVSLRSASEAWLLTPTVLDVAP